MEKLTFEEVSRLNERKTQLKVAHTRYIESHPELKSLMTDFMCALLLEKPEDIYAFSKQYFSAFEPGETTSAQSHLRPLVIAGPSGVGKGTLIKMLMKDFPDAFGFCVSHTTRAPRPGEVHGEAYYFVQRDAMQADIDAGKFVEHAQVHGNLYGTSIAAINKVQEQGKVCILDIDVQGVKKVKTTDQNARFLFVKPVSMQVLEERLRGRGTETDERILLRLANAAAELEYADENGAANFDKVLVNDDLETAYAELREQILEWFPHLSR